MKTKKLWCRNNTVKIITCFAVILFLSPFVYLGCEFFKFLYGGKTVTDIEIYKSGKYLDYAFGSGTVNFMPKYEDLAKYCTIRFEYTDSKTHNTIFHKFPSSFTLDVVYDSSIYEKEKRVLCEKYDIASITNEQDITESGKFTFYLLNKNADNGTVKVLAFSDELTTIKYVVIEDIWGEELMGCAHALSWSNVGFVGFEWEQNNSSMPNKKPVYFLT